MALARSVVAQSKLLTARNARIVKAWSIVANTIGCWSRSHKTKNGLCRVNENRVAGWQGLAENDAGLNYQHLEDRASVIYWRCMMAVYFEQFSLAEPVVLRALDAVPRLWKMPAGRFWLTPAVGSVEVVGCEPAGSSAEANAEFDRMRVVVRWSATQAEGDRRRPRRLDHQRIYSHELILVRQRGVQTIADQAFSSPSCPNCGGNIDVGGSPDCEYCETPLNDGSWDWVLADVVHHDSLKTAMQDRADRLERERFFNEPELLASLVRMVMVDGNLATEEREFVANLARRRGVSGERLEQVFATALSDKQPIQLPDKPEDARLFLDQLIRAALIDGSIRSPGAEVACRCQQPTETGLPPI